MSSLTELCTKLIASKGNATDVNVYLTMIYNLPEYKCFFPRGFTGTNFFAIENDVFLTAEKCAMYSNNMILLASCNTHVVVGQESPLLHDFYLVLVPVATNEYLFRNMIVHRPSIIECSKIIFESKLQESESCTIIAEPHFSQTSDQPQATVICDENVEIKKDEPQFLHYLRTCQRAHKHVAETRLKCELSNWHLISKVGQTIQTPRFNVIVKQFDQENIHLCVKVDKDADCSTQSVLNHLAKSAFSKERITRHELKCLVDEMFETGVFDSEQTYVNGASYSDHCVLYVVVPK